MKYALALAALLALGVDAQKKDSGSGKSGGKACTPNKDQKPPEDPFLQFTPGAAQWPCQFGASVPFGKIPTGCVDLEVIIARGTSEPGNLGSVVGDPLAARVAKNIGNGKKARGYPVQYPAGIGDFSSGPKDIKNRIANQMKNCPNEKFAIVGYSQGGSVIQGGIKGLTAEQQAKVVAVVTYGNGAVVNGLPKNMQAKTLTNCAPGDFLCPNGATTVEGHLTYNNVGTKWHDRSAQWIIDGYNGKLLPGPRKDMKPS